MRTHHAIPTYIHIYIYIPPRKREVESFYRILEAMSRRRVKPPTIPKKALRNEPSLSCQQSPGCFGREFIWIPSRILCKISKKNTYRGTPNRRSSKLYPQTSVVALRFKTPAAWPCLRWPIAGRVTKNCTAWIAQHVLCRSLCSHLLLANLKMTVSYFDIFLQESAYFYCFSV